MHAVDTNVVIRYLTADDLAQAEKARAIFEGGDVFISVSVLLETEWVLRNIYRVSGIKLHAALTAICGLPGIQIESPVKAARALAWLEAGMDFADAMHLAAADSCEDFLTFDNDVTQIAARVADIKVRVA